MTLRAARRLWLPVLAAFLAGGVSQALAHEGTRQIAASPFEERRPATSTGVRLAIDYVNPDDPNAKPPAVQKVVIAYAPGTTIDTSVPEQCDASNGELTAQGPAACPPASIVGGGEIDLDTGIPGPGRIAQNDVTLINNRDELILLLESRSEPRSRVVARAVVQGGTITSEVAPVPGGPPDGFTAIKRVRLTADARSAGQGAGRRNYVTTPASCPAGGAWTNTVTFTYRDGVTQTARSSSPCVPAGGGSCRRASSVGFRLKRRDLGRVVRVEAFVNGRRALRRSGRDLRRMRLRGLPRSGAMRLRIVTTRSTGTKVISTRTWRGCRKGRTFVRIVRRRQAQAALRDGEPIPF
jgi:hypothetical protein